MRIKIEFNGEVYYRACSEAYRWTGHLKGSPDWLVQYVEDEEAVVAKGDRAFLFIGIKNGFPRASVGDIIVKDGEYIDIIRKAEP